MKLSREARATLEHLYTETRHHEITRAILEIALENPVVTVDQMADDIEASHEEFVTALEQLVQQGLLMDDVIGEDDDDNWSLQGSDDTSEEELSEPSDNEPEELEEEIIALFGLRGYRAVQQLRQSPALLSQVLNREITTTDIAKMVNGCGIRANMLNPNYHHTWFSISVYDPNDNSYCITIPSEIYLGEEKNTRRDNGEELLHIIRRTYPHRYQLNREVTEALNNNLNNCYYYQSPRHNQRISLTDPEIIHPFDLRDLDIDERSLNTTSYPWRGKASNGRNVIIRLVNSSHLLFAITYTRVNSRRLVIDSDSDNE